MTESRRRKFFKAPRITVFLILLALFLLLIAVYFYFYSKYSADTNGNVESIRVSGYTFYSIDDSIPSYQGSSRKAPGARVSFLCSDSVCTEATKEFTAYSDSNGHFDITIENPAPCSYRVIAGGNEKYNARDNGKIKLNGSSKLVTTNVVVDDQVDLMHSNYTGSNYEDGYNGYYHFSASDIYIFRNRIQPGLVLSPVAPTSSTVKVPVARINGAWPVESVTKPIYTIEIPITLSIQPIISSWKSDGMPTLGPVLDSKSFMVKGDTPSFDVNFSANLSKLTEGQRFYTAKNGFAISFAVDYSKAKDESQILMWRNVNIDMLIPRSEDNGKNEIAKTEYSGNEKIKTSSKIGFEGPLVSPVGGRSKLVVTSDFGYRGISQSRCHRGLDFATGYGEIIQSVSDGIVITSEYSERYFGEYVIIKHCNDMYTWYGHMIIGSRKVSAGQRVSAGTALGLSDSSGSSSGNHLHFSVAFGSPTNYADPMLFFSDMVSSIDVAERGSIIRNKGTEPDGRHIFLAKDPCIVENGWIINK